MTAPTTHDTRTVILGDEEIMAESRTKWDAQQFAQGARFARSIYEPHVAKLEAEIALLRKLVSRQAECLTEFDRAIGEHSAPHDCYATGPMTGDSFSDLIQCPACSAREVYKSLPAAPTQGGGAG